MEFAPVNYLAVLVAGIAQMVLGMVWYSKALFWNPWQRANGVTDEQVKTTARPAMTADIVGGLVIAYGIARLMSAMQVTGYWWGLFLALLIAVTIIAPIMLSSVLHTAKPMRLFWIDFGYRFVGILLAGLIIGVW
jgi:hypothetical protein